MLKSIDNKGMLCTKCGGTFYLAVARFIDIVLNSVKLCIKVYKNNKKKNRWRPVLF